MNSIVSIVIPTRRERFLQRTIDDIFEKATGEVELIVSLDGYWPDPPLKDRKNQIILHHGRQVGMRTGINDAMHIAKGDYLMKIDGHCMLDEGFDEKLKADCDENWLVVPRRYSLEPEQWIFKDNGKPPVDYHYLSWPFESGCEAVNSPIGLHGNVWTQRARERKDIEIDDEMSSQGSCWFTTKKHWERILDPMDIDHYGTFRQEFQELGGRTFLSGGRVVINKKTFYCHLHKGKTYGYGYGFSNARWKQWAEEAELGRCFCIDFWMNDRPFKNKTRSFKWLIEKFWPLPGWPDNWEEIAASITWPEQRWKEYQKLCKESGAI